MKRILYFLPLIFLAFAACEDQLDVSNPNQTSAEDYWVSEESAVKGTNAIYAGLQRKGTYRRWLYFAYDVRSDQAYSRSPWADLSNFSKFTLNDYNFEVNYEIFQDHYRGIFRANQVLTYVPGIDMDAQLKARLLGEAYFLRGLYFFNLAVLYGGVPLATTVPTDPSQGSPQATEAQVWEQLIDDLKQAQSALPQTYPASDKGRATWGAATALLAKAYMQNRQWSQARAELKKIVEDNDGLYELESDFTHNFRHTTENSVESVFEVQFSNVYENGPDQDGTATASLGCNRAIFFAPAGVGWSDAEATEWLVDQFYIEADADGNLDPRLDASLIYDKPDSEDPVNNVYGVPYDTRFPPGHSKHGSQWIRKYQNDYWRTSENWDSPINFKVIRYADVLLLYAETLNETGATDQAYTYIDLVRERSNMQPLSTAQPALSQSQMREQIKHERTVELAGESVRFMDLKRWQMLSPDLQANDAEFEYFQTGRSELLPIPTQEVDLNDIEQNPNW